MRKYEYFNHPYTGDKITFYPETKIGQKTPKLIFMGPFKKPSWEEFLVLHEAVYIFYMHSEETYII